MATHTRTRAHLVIGASLAILLSAIGDAHAACNLIPVAKRRFPSTIGGVTTPITAPGKTIELVVSACDASPGFNQDAADNLVTLTFAPPTLAGTTEVAIDPLVVSVADCTLAGNRCATLRFPAPSTVGGGNPAHGLAGPASISVKDGDTTIAQIDALFQPTFGCDRFPETVFERFTVLPPANNFANLISGDAPELLASVDGSGSLLVPFDFWGNGDDSVLPEDPGSPLAIFLEGSATIPANGIGDTETVQDVIMAQSSPSKFARSFTLDGRPLPPLLRVTNTGDLFGSADAIESVLRIARNDGEGGPDLYDLSSLLEDGKGPIVLTTFAFDKREPIPMASLRTSDVSVAYARDESREDDDLNLDGDKADFVMQIVNSSTAGAINTGFATTQLPVPPQYLASPVGLDTKAGVIGFVESEYEQDDDRNLDLDFGDNFLRVFNRNGIDLTAATPAADTEMAVEYQVDRKPLAVSGDRVFFRGPGAFVQSIVANGGNGITGNTGAVISPDGKHVYVIGTGESAVAIFSRNLTTGRLSFVGTVPVSLVPFQFITMPPDYQGGGTIAISPDGAHVYARAARPINKVTVFSRDSVTGLLTFVEEQEQGVAGVDGLDGLGPIAVSPDGDHVYVASHYAPSSIAEIARFERDPGTGALTYLGVVGGAPIGPLDFNMTFGPGDTMYVDRAVYSRDAGTGALTLVQALGLPDLFIHVAIRSDGRFGYLARSDGVTGVVDVLPRNTVDGSLGGVIQTVKSPSNGIPYGLAVSPAGDRLYVAYANVPLSLLDVYEIDAGSGRLALADEHVLGAAGSSGGPGTLSVTPNGADLLIAGSFGGSSSIHAYHAGASVAAFDAETQTMRPTRVPGTSAAVAAERAVIRTPESFAGNLNGDADARDVVAQLLDVSGVGDQLVPLGVAAADVAISSDVVAITVPEASQGNVSRNADGDPDDTVLAVFPIGDAPPPVNVGLAARLPVASEDDVAFLRPEAQEPQNAPGCTPAIPIGCDLNGDGDANDEVLHVYHQDTGLTDNLGLAVGSFGTVSPFGFPDYYYGGEIEGGGRLVAFLVPESAQGVGSLNDDNDLTDSVMHVLDLDTMTVVNTHAKASPCLFTICHPGVHYRIDPVRRTVSFLMFEFDDGHDLNGDGDSTDVLLNVFGLVADRSQIVTVLDVTQSSAPPSPPLPDELFGGAIALVQQNEINAGQDLNGDGVIGNDSVVLLAGDTDDDGSFDDYDTCVEATNPTQVDEDADALGDGTCDALVALCPPAPLPGCHQAGAGKSALALKNSTVAGKDKLSWKWDKGDTVLAEFGDPTSTEMIYTLCLYDGSAEPQPLQTAAVPSQRFCGKKPCWKPIGTKGYKLNDKAGFPDGVTGMSVQAGTGKAKLQVKAGGLALDLPALPLTLPVTVQLIAHTGMSQACWSTEYTVADENLADGFKAKGP